MNWDTPQLWDFHPSLIAVSPEVCCSKFPAPLLLPTESTRFDTLWIYDLLEWLFLNGTYMNLDTTRLWELQSSFIDVAPAVCWSTRHAPFLSTHRPRDSKLLNLWFARITLPIWNLYELRYNSTVIAASQPHCCSPISLLLNVSCSPSPPHRAHEIRSFWIVDLLE